MATRWPVLGAISAGGALGAVGRWALATAWPVHGNGFPWATFATNVSGCLLIGVLTVLITEVWVSRPLLRPFLGVGVLGGYTTFSTATVEGARLLSAGAGWTGMVYVTATVLAALTAVYLGTVLTRLVIRRRRRA
jgi:CrcB protein